MTMGHSHLLVIFLLLNEILCSEIHTVIVCDDNMMNIDCAVNFTISIIRANYGRFSVAVCNDHAKQDIDISCDSAEKTTDILKKRYEIQIHCN